MKMMKYLAAALLSVLMISPVMAQDCCAKKGGSDKTCSRMIQTTVPERPAGQQDMLAFRAPKLQTVRIGIIGLGMRGVGAVDRLSLIEGTDVVALCDLHQDRTEKSNAILTKNGRHSAELYYGSDDAWKKLVERPDIDLIYIVTNWQTHVEMAKYAMEQGKHVAVEVPTAFSLDDIWTLIDTSERTRKHCMMLENCVYDFFEMTTLNMKNKGLLGDILYAEGGYIHNLEDFWPYYEGDWRMDYNIKNRGDVYPTHGMGPAAQILDLHRGDKMNVLVSMDTTPRNLPAYLEETRGMKDAKVANGQHTMTMIRTEKGRTIFIHHDVTTHRPYSRQYNVAGTKGYASKYPAEHYALAGTDLKNAGMPAVDDLSTHSWVSPEMQKELYEKYKHPITRELEKRAKEVGGHGGMDFIMDYRLIYCLRNGLPLDMDVYDMAEWCSLIPLSQISLEHGFAPVEVPDFTRGAWQRLKGYHHYMVGD